MRQIAMSRNFVLCAVAWVLCFVVTTTARASEGPEPVLHITTYTSPSAHYTLTVDPTRLHGGGPATYRVERDRVLVWEKELEFTFWEAAITDDGIAVGYAYTSGWRGFDGARPGEIVIAIIGPDGAIKGIERRPRNEQVGFHAPPGPTAFGCFVDPKNDRFVVRFAAQGRAPNNYAERWETYSLSEGKRLDDVKLVPPGGSDELWYMAGAVQAVGDSGLTLVAWMRTHWALKEEGIRLALVDAHAHEVWNVERPREFAVDARVNRWNLERLNLIGTFATRSFFFRSPADQARITFAVDRDETNGWKVIEASRTSESVAVTRDMSSPPTLPVISLESRGQTTLQSAGQSRGPMARVFDFHFDGQGRIGFVDATEAGLRFNLFLADGTLAKSVPLPGVDAPNSANPAAVWIGGDRWILLRSELGERVTMTGYALDVGAGSVKVLDPFNSPRTYQQSIKGTVDRFAVRGDHTDRRIAIFDATGKELWSYGNPVLSAQDIAFSSRGELGILGGIENRIVVQSAAGTFVRTIDIASGLGRAPNYVAGLEADAQGGWILYDFGGDPCIYRLDAEGTVVSKFTPHYADGRTFRLYGNVKRAPDGRLWTSDGAALLRLTDEGVVDFVIGRSIESEALGEIRCATIDSNGNIYAVDARNAFVHKFDAQGTPLHIFKPEPTDFEIDAGLGSITIAGDGAIYYLPATHAMRARGYLKFAADGSRAGFQDGITGEVVDEWIFRPGSNERLAIGYERAFLVDAEGKKRRTIDRRADRRWIDQPESAAFAPNGTFVIVSRPRSWSDGGSYAVTHYSAVGDALKTFELPQVGGFPSVVTNGKTMAVISGESAVVIDVASGAMQTWLIPAEAHQVTLGWYLSEHGTELCGIDGAKPVVHRFAMP